MSEHRIVLSRVPFRIPLGGGSTDLPSYYEKYGGFIFGVTINLYMDVLIKKTRSDDLIHVHYKHFEAVPNVELIQHELAREALLMCGVNSCTAISFKADTPEGTGLGSSGACSVALLKGLATYNGVNTTNLEAAAKSFKITQNLGLPDGVQDPYVCSMGGFVVFDIEKDGSINFKRAGIKKATADKFFSNSLFYYTGVSRPSKKILSGQDQDKILNLKHQTKEIGINIWRSFQKDDLDSFGQLMNEHWQVKRSMSSNITSDKFDEIYNKAIKAGALGGKIMGAGGGGYFMFYCPSVEVKERVRIALEPFNMRQMFFSLDNKGARTKIITL